MKVNFAPGLKVAFGLEADVGRIDIRATDPEHSGEGISLFDFEICRTTPIRADARRGGIRNVRVLPDQVREFLRDFYREWYDGSPRASFVGYFSPEEARRLAEVLGPKFPQRLFLANKHAFIDPLNRTLGEKFMLRFSRAWPSGAWQPQNIRWMFHGRDSLAMLKEYGHERLIPIAHLYGYPKEPGQDVLQAMRQHFDKASWKQLIGQSLTRTLAMHRLVVPFTMGWHADPARTAERATNLLTALVRIPSTILQTLELEALHEHERLEVLANLASGRPFPYKQVHQYVRLADMWGDVNRHLGGRASVHWSPRRIHDEHGRMMEVQREEMRRRRAAEMADMEVPFTHGQPVPHTFSDRSSRLVARLLNTKADYMRQGENQHHCVGSYGVQGMQGNCFTYSIEDEHGLVISTAMFAPDGRVRQHYACYNQTVTNQDALRIATDITMHMRVLLALRDKDLPV